MEFHFRNHSFCEQSHFAQITNSTMFVPPTLQYPDNSISEHSVAVPTSAAAIRSTRLESQPVSQPPHSVFRRSSPASISIKSDRFHNASSSTRSLRRISGRARALTARWIECGCFCFCFGLPAGTYHPAFGAPMRWNHFRGRLAGLPKVFRNVHFYVLFSIYSEQFIVKGKNKT